MKRISRQACLLCLLWPAAAARPAWSAEPAGSAEFFNGWRGNGNGLWSQARPPLTWSRIPQGALQGLEARANRPAAEGPRDAARVERGLVREWLVLGPLAAPDSEADFGEVPHEILSAEPSAGDTTAGLAWRKASTPADDPMVFGTAELPWLDLAREVGFALNQCAYAHAYLFSPRGGKVVIVVDHAHGLAAWLNEVQVYSSPRRGVGLGHYTAISRHELNHLDQPSPRFECTLHAGWNRLLVKTSTANQPGFTDMRFCMRIMDPPNVPYESRGIAWMTELPGRSTSTPVVARDRIFVMAEPDELLCVQSATGRILWSATCNLLDAVTDDERRANPAFAELIDPLLARLRAEPDRKARTALRGRIQQALEQIDADRFMLACNDHFESHFGIVGFTMPTPVCDGRCVYVWNNMGVAACFDLQGRRRWIRRIPSAQLGYGSSPALADGVLALFLDKVHGLDAQTGATRWMQHRVSRNIASLLAARLAGQNVFVTQRGEVLRPADGALLFRPRGFGSGDTGWSPPVIVQEKMYLPKYGVTQLLVYDFSGVSGEQWEPKLEATIETPPEVSRRADGGWIDRWTAGSPLIWQGLAYQADIYQTGYVFDLEKRKLAAWQPLPLNGLTHYNAVAVAASPALIGRHIYLLDNQGTTLVLEPGAHFKLAAVSRIETQLARDWPIPAQETLAYAPPVVDADRIILRGERFLYCLGPSRD